MLALLCLSVPAAPVQVRVVDRTYPVILPERTRKRGFPYAPKLAGKEAYTTKLVILENEYLEVHVLPELGGRLVRSVFKPAAEQLLWEFDEIREGRSWSMGGGRWSFPFWEHGRHFDETGGYTVVRHEDGSATLAIDMRFEDFLKRAETGRYGRATNLRLVQLVNMRPGEALFTWTARVDNPLPIRCGFKLWWLLRQPSLEGTQIILPAAAVTGHGTGQLNAWDRSRDIRQGMKGTSVFAIGIRHDFAGWYFPERDLNVLRILDHAGAPGAKQVLYPPAPGGYIEMWGGNNEVFEECGRILPAFGAHQVALNILPAMGIGRAAFANKHAAVGLSKDESGWILHIVPTRDLRNVGLFAECGDETRNFELSAAPDRPASWKTGIDSASFHFRLIDGAGAVLVDQVLPIDVGPAPEKAFLAAQARTRGTMPGGKGLYAEATDLTSEHQFSLPRAERFLAGILTNAIDRVTLLDASRRLMRVRESPPEVPTALDKVLADNPRDPHANLYKAIWLMEAGKPTEADKYLPWAWPLPGGRYLRALRAMAGKQYAAVVEHVGALLAMEPEDSFWGKDDHALALMQPNCFMAATRPRLLLALALDAQGKREDSRRTLLRLLEQDPACIEAWMLLGDGERVETLTERNASGKRAAEETLSSLRAGRWRGIGRPL